MVRCDEKTMTCYSYVPEKMYDQHGLLGYCHTCINVGVKLEMSVRILLEQDLSYHITACKP